MLNSHGLTMGTVVQSTSLVDTESAALACTSRIFNLGWHGTHLENHRVSFHWCGVGWDVGEDLPWYQCILKVPGDSNVWWGLRSTALNSASFAPKFFRLCRMSGWKLLYAIQPDILPQPPTSPANPALTPGSGPMTSVQKAGLRSSRAAVAAQHPHLGCCSHSAIVALALIPPSLLDSILCLSLSCLENLPGVSSPGPA